MDILLQRGNAATLGNLVPALSSAQMEYCKVYCKGSVGGGWKVMDAGDTRAKSGLKGLDSKFCQMEQD